MLIVDIETRRCDASLQLYNEHVPVRVPAHYKKEDTIARFQQSQAIKRQEHAALLPWTGRIVSIAYGFVAWAEEKSPVVRELVCSKRVDAGLDPNDEPSLLRSFWSLVRDYSALPLIGYNLLGFDIPFIVLRSMVHGVQPSRKLSMARFRTDEVFDMMMWLANWDLRQVLKLDVACTLLGIENPLPGVDGSQVEDMSEKELAKYGTAEIDKLFALYQRMEAFYG